MRRCTQAGPSRPAMTTDEGWKERVKYFCSLTIITYHIEFVAYLWGIKNISTHQCKDTEHVDFLCAIFYQRFITQALGRGENKKEVIFGPTYWVLGIRYDAHEHDFHWGCLQPSFGQRSTATWSPGGWWTSLFLYGTRRVSSVLPCRASPRPSVICDG